MGRHSTFHYLRNSLEGFEDGRRPGLRPASLLAFGLCLVVSMFLPEALCADPTEEDPEQVCAPFPTRPGDTSPVLVARVASADISGGGSGNMIPERSRQNRADRDTLEVAFDQRPDLPESLLRVLMSRSVSDPRWYPSPYQVGPSTVRVSGRVRGTTNGSIPVWVYLRVVDDRSSADDGKERETPGSVELVGDGLSEAGYAADQVWLAKVGLDGRFVADARFVPQGGHRRAAGDGFFIQASPDAAFSCGDACPRTGVFRLWKRVYVERDAMYRSGVWIEGEGAEGSTRLAVDDVTPFKRAKPDRPIEVILMHAPSVAGRKDGADRHREEPNLVVGVERPDRRGRRGMVELAYPTLRRFGEPGAADAIVIPDDGVFELPSIDAAKAVFSNAFVEVIEVENPHGTVPHRVFSSEELGEDFSAFAQRWSDYGPATPASPHNTVMIVSASHKTQRLPNGDAVMHPAIGSCNIRPAPVNNVFLWQEAVETQVKQNARGVGIGGMDPEAVIEELVIHEMAHVFGVDDCDDHGELLNADGTGLSTMNVPVGPEMGDGVTGLHLSEYREISLAADPLPQS